SMFVILEPFANRRSDDLYADAIIARLKARITKEVPEANVNIFLPAAVQGLGRTGGFKLMVEDRGEAGLAALQGQTENLVEKGNQQPSLKDLFTVFNIKSPQVYVDVNRTECLTQGVDLNDVFD